MCRKGYTRAADADRADADRAAADRATEGVYRKGYTRAPDARQHDGDGIITTEWRDAGIIAETTGDDTNVGGA